MKEKEAKKQDYIRALSNPLFVAVVDRIFREVEIAAVEKEDYETAAHYRDLQKADAFRVSWDAENNANAIQIITTEEAWK